MNIDWFKLGVWVGLMIANVLCWVGIFWAVHLFFDFL